MSLKSRILDIQHKLNSDFANNDDPSIVRRMNLLNSDLFEMVALYEKDEPYSHILDSIKDERDKLSPLQSSEMEIIDTLVYELDQLLYSDL